MTEKEAIKLAKKQSKKYQCIMFAVPKVNTNYTNWEIVSAASINRYHLDLPKNKIHRFDPN